VVATIQAFLDTRSAVVPRYVKRIIEESPDEFGSFGFEINEITLAQLGGAESVIDDIQNQDKEFAGVSFVPPPTILLIKDSGNCDLS
jgi:hypothetical protein